MTTSAIQVINTTNLTEYTFNVLGQYTNHPIDTYSVFVEFDDIDNIFEVAFLTVGLPAKYKRFKDETDANMHAMKLLLKYKKEC